MDKRKLITYIFVYGWHQAQRNSSLSPAILNVVQCSLENVHTELLFQPAEMNSPIGQATTMTSCLKSKSQKGF